MRIVPNAVEIALKVHPRARRNAVDGWHGDALKLSVTAPPEQGKANRACEELLAERLGIAPSRCSVVGGAASSRKVMRLEGITLAEVEAALPPR